MLLRLLGFYFYTATQRSAPFDDCLSGQRAFDAAYAYSGREFMTCRIYF